MFNWGYFYTVYQGATVKKDQESCKFFFYYVKTNPTKKSKTRHRKENKPYLTYYGNYDFWS